MKYREQAQLVKDLRDLADFLERPESIALPSLYGGTFSASGTVGEWGTKSDGNYGKIVDESATRANMRQFARIMKPVDKDYSGGTFTLRKKFGKLQIAINTDREAVCRMVKTGEVIEHAEIVLPARTEEVVEWVCDDPLLASSK